MFLLFFLAVFAGEEIISPEDLGMHVSKLKQGPRPSLLKSHVISQHGRINLQVLGRCARKTDQHTDIDWYLLVMLFHPKGTVNILWKTAVYLLKKSFRFVGFVSQSKSNNVCQKQRFFLFYTFILLYFKIFTFLAPMIIASGRRLFRVCGT